MADRDDGGYWKKRSEAVMDRQAASAEETAAELARAYGEAETALRRDLENFYSRFAQSQEISYSEARRLLSKRELRRWKYSLEEFRQKAIDGGWEKELNAEYYRSRVNRLQAIQIQLRMRIRELKTHEHETVRQQLKRSFTDSYYRTMYELRTGRGEEASFFRFDETAVERIVSRPWAGDSFSGRIWKDREKLSNELSRTLSQSVVRGEPLEQTARLLSKRMEVSRSNAMRLVRTETSHVAAEATMRCYGELGVKQYQFLASLSERTCAVCGALDGKVFLVSDQQPGVNCNPLHPNCRCTTLPYFDDEFTQDEMRSARDPRTGKSIFVKDQSYEEWLRGQESVDKPKDSGIIKAGRDNMELSRGALTGALDPDSREAEEHSKRYYDFVRKMKTDCSSIARNVGWNVRAIETVKRHIFYDYHDLGGPEPERFDPDYHMAVSWQRLIEGKEIQEMDLVLLKHEYLESILMKHRGFSYREAHDQTNRLHNYARYTRED